MSRRSRLRRAPALLLRRLDALRRDDSGMALVEFALVATTMIFMYVGSAQLSDAINANRRVTITARAMADLASRTPSDTGSRIGELTEGQISTIIAASTQVLSPFPSAKAQVRVSEVWKCAVPTNPEVNTTLDPAHADFNLATCLSSSDARTDTAKSPVVGVRWSRTNNNGLSALTAATLPANISAGTVLIQADVNYSHTPWFIGFNFGTINLSETIFMVPRNSNTVQLLVP